MGGVIEEAEVVNEEAETEEPEEMLEDVPGAKKATKLQIQRYKGLGEMNPEELWETTMNSKTRVLKKVNIDEAKEADKIFTILMGSEVEPRRLFIQSHAKMANLDV